MSKLGLQPTTVEEPNGDASPSEGPGVAESAEPPAPEAEGDRADAATSLRDDGEPRALVEEPGDRTGPQKGFSTKYQKGSLVEWLALVEFVEGDALVTIESSAGRKGFLWCSGGQIIDARCDTLTGEGAFFEIVGTEAGQVSLTFAKVDRPQVIESTTKELLQKAGARRAGQQISIAPSPHSHSAYPVTVSGIRDRAGSAEAPPSLPAEATAPPPAEQPAAPWWRAEWGWAPYVGIAVLTLVLGAALMVIFTRAFSRSAASSASSPETSAAAANLGAPAIVPEGQFVLDLDVDPPAAEIWLDDAQVGPGHARRLLARDGREHEIRLVAPGYVAQSILFRDATLVRRVFMEKIVSNRAAAEAPPAVDHPAPRPPERPAHAVEARPKRAASPPSPPKASEPHVAETASARPAEAPARPPEMPAPSRPKAPTTGRNSPKIQIVE